MIGNRLADVGQLASFRQVQVDIVVPQFDGRVTDLARDANLVEDRRRPDCAGVQAVDEVRHDGEPILRGKNSDRQAMVAMWATRYRGHCESANADGRLAE
ncbi:MAG: hypothetical protein FD138_511 [Planctomycetota bacterium]|nr:MAG: hypothetical protein FD138_511 [Planctomycetota bacterium]